MASINHKSITCVRFGAELRKSGQHRADQPFQPLFGGVGGHVTRLRCSDRDFPEFPGANFFNGRSVHRVFQQMVSQRRRGPVIELDLHGQAGILRCSASCLSTAAPRTSNFPVTTSAIRRVRYSLRSSIFRFSLLIDLSSTLDSTRTASSIAFCSSQSGIGTGNARFADHRSTYSNGEPPGPHKHVIECYSPGFAGYGPLLSADSLELTEE